MSCVATDLTVYGPRKGPPRFLSEGRMSMTKSGLTCVYCV